MDLGVLLESPQGSQSSTRVGASTCAFTRAVAAVSRFPSRGSRDPWLSIEAFPRGFPTSLNHRAVPRVIVLWVDPRLEIRGSAGKTGFPGMDLDIWGTLGMVARPWSSSRLSCGAHLLLRCEENAGNSFPNTQGKDPSSRARIGNGTPLDVGGTLVLPLEWRPVCRGTSELQQGCEGPF